MAAFELDEGPVEMQEPSRWAPTAERLPLWVLRKPNGKPNYASASEQERYLRESGAHTQRKTPSDAWESWVVAQNDPRRVPPADVDPETLHELQRQQMFEAALTPTERLAQATVDTDEPYQLALDDETKGVAHEA